MTFELGLDAVEVAPGERARIYSQAAPSSTWCVCGTAREPATQVALRRFLARRDAQVADLMTYAKALNVLGPTRAMVDILTAS